MSTSKSQRLRLRDLKHIYRLIGECLDLGTDATTWRRHMFDRLCRLTGSRVGSGGEMRNFWDGFFTGELQILDAVDAGWMEAEPRQRWLEYLAAGGPQIDPIFRRLAALPKRRRLTRTRRQLMDDQVWYASEQFNEYRRMSEVDHCINALNTLTALPQADCIGEVVHTITLHRSVGERDFSPRECRLVHWFHHELTPLIGRQLASADEPLLSHLAPRVRQVFACLLEGDSEKQVAHRLAIKRETVHQYVKTLYRHFGVHSRAELLARWFRGGRYDRNEAANPDHS